MADKILVSNTKALTAKYGAAGVQAIQAAIAKLVAVDQGRGLQTVVAAVDDAATMNAAGGSAVTNPGDSQQNKNAVDALYRFYTAQYIVLLGSVDVIPHQALSNPTYNPDPVNGDPDKTVPSDLPYACDAPYSLDIKDFVGPGRVVSRLPDVTGDSDPSYLVHILELASGANVLAQADYADYLGVSASVWSQSTGLSLNAIFGASAAMQSVPPAGFQWPSNLLERRSHFFNCHGAPASAQYLGQLGTSRPVAHDAKYISGKLTPGTVASIECCYGAELYDPTFAPNQQIGIGNVYLGDGAYGFWGSTTISYGPSSSNADADLICQYFLSEVLKGASIGHAALSARQTFVQNISTMSPLDLKTLGQFILLGDAAIQCVPSADPGAQVASKFAAVGILEFDSNRLSRMERRLQFATTGRVLEQTKPVSEPNPIAISPDVRDRLEQIGSKMGLQNPAYASYRVSQGSERKFLNLDAVMPEASAPDAFHLLYEGRLIGESRVPSIRIVEVTETDGKFVRVRELFSR
jgi:hypothetical protein